MTVIKFLFFIRALAAIEPIIFVAYFSIIFPRAVSYFNPAMVRLIFIHGMGRVSIIGG